MFQRLFPSVLPCRGVCCFNFSFFVCIFMCFFFLKSCPPPYSVLLRKEHFIHSFIDCKTSSAWGVVTYCSLPPILVFPLAPSLSGVLSYTIDIFNLPKVRPVSHPTRLYCHIVGEGDVCCLCSPLESEQGNCPTALSGVEPCHVEQQENVVRGSTRVKCLQLNPYPHFERCHITGFIFSRNNEKI